MIKIKKFDVYLTRGDSARISVMLDPPLEEADAVVRFSLKKSTADVEPLIEKDPYEVLENQYTYLLEPLDTDTLAFGQYVWDVRCHFADGSIYTPPEFPAKFYIQEVVGNV